MHPYMFTGQQQQQQQRASRSSDEGSSLGAVHNDFMGGMGLYEAPSRSALPAASAMEQASRDEYFQRFPVAGLSPFAASGAAGLSAPSWAGPSHSMLPADSHMRVRHSQLAAHQPAYTAMSSRFGGSAPPYLSSSAPNVSNPQLAALQALQQAWLGRAAEQQQQEQHRRPAAAFELAGMHANMMMPQTRPAWAAQLPERAQQQAMMGASSFTSLERAACDMWAFVASSANSTASTSSSASAISKLATKQSLQDGLASASGVRSPSTRSPYNSLTARDRELLQEVAAKAASLNSEAEGTHASCESAHGGGSLASAASTLVTAALEQEQDSLDCSLSATTGTNKRKRVSDSDCMLVKKAATAILAELVKSDDKNLLHSVNSDGSSASFEGEDDGLSLGPGLPPCD
jgi:hypothetical protein